jgi:hypothetical protein
MTHVGYLLPALLLVPFAASGAQPPPPGRVIGEFEAGSTVATSEEGIERWTTEWTMREDVVESQSVIRMTEQGEGTYTGFENEIQWRTEALWLGGEMLRPLESEKVFTDADGRPLLTERTEFDRANNVIRFEREDSRTGEQTSDTWEMPPNTLSVEGIAAALRTMPLEEGTSVPAHVFTPEPGLYEVTLEVRGRETLDSADGPVESYKVEVVPSLGLLGLFRFLVPNTYFWFAADPPHTWIRYEGPENGRGTPEITIERVN